MGNGRGSLATQTARRAAPRAASRVWSHVHHRQVGAHQAELRRRVGPVLSQDRQSTLALPASKQYRMWLGRNRAQVKGLLLLHKPLHPVANCLELALLDRINLFLHLDWGGSGVLFFLPAPLLLVSQSPPDGDAMQFVLLNKSSHLLRLKLAPRSEALVLWVLAPLPVVPVEHHELIN